MRPRLGISYAEWNRIKAPNWPSYEDLDNLHWDDLDESYRNDIKNRILYIPSYHRSLVPILKHTFEGIEKISRTYSTQCDADILTLILFNGKKDGTYLELGAGDPCDSNNTYLLSKLGWKGISVDCDPKILPAWRKCRPQDNFYLQDATKINYSSILSSSNLPQKIDLLQIDIEDAFLNQTLLPIMPFDQYRFSLIMVEHNRFLNGDKSKLACNSFFSERGYIKLFNNMVCRDHVRDTWAEFEDWWIWPEDFDQQLIDKFQTPNADKTWSFEVLCQPNSLEEIDLAKNSKNIWNVQNTKGDL